MAFQCSASKHQTSVPSCPFSWAPTGTEDLVFTLGWLSSQTKKTKQNTYSHTLEFAENSPPILFPNCNDRLSTSPKLLFMHPYVKETGISASHQARGTLWSLEFSESGRLSSNCSSEVMEEVEDQNQMILFQCPQNAVSTPSHQNNLEDFETQRSTYWRWLMMRISRKGKENRNCDP